MTDLSLDLQRQAAAELAMAAALAWMMDAMAADRAFHQAICRHSSPQLRALRRPQGWNLMIRMPFTPIADGGQTTLVIQWFQVAACFIDDPGFDLRGDNVPIPIYRSSQFVGRRAGLRDLTRADIAGDDLEIAGLRSHGADDIQRHRWRLQQSDV